MHINYSITIPSEIYMLLLAIAFVWSIAMPIVRTLVAPVGNLFGCLCDSGLCLSGSLP